MNGYTRCPEAPRTNCGQTQTRGRPVPRYTPTVGPWQRRVSLVVLSVLAALPVSGTVCAALCVAAVHAAVAQSEHHATRSHSHESAPRGFHVRGTSGHDCNRPDSPGREATATMAAARSYSGVPSTVQHVTPAAPNRLAATWLHLQSDSSPPPGWASSTPSPLVLRV